MKNGGILVMLISDNSSLRQEIQRLAEARVECSSREKDTGSAFTVSEAEFCMMTFELA